MSFTLQSCNSKTNECNFPMKGFLSSANNVFTNWKTFMNMTSKSADKFDDKHFQWIQNHDVNITGPVIPTIYRNYAFMSKNNIKVAANSMYTFSAVLSWYFPYRTYHSNTQYLGNYYNILYDSSDEVNNDIINKLPRVINNILSWQQLFYNSIHDLYPDYLKDVYLNGPGYIARTSFYTEPHTNNNTIDTPQFGYNYTVGDLLNMPIELNNNSNYKSCWQLCNETMNCQAWSFTDASCNNTYYTYPMCWLKGDIPLNGTSNKCAVSGIVNEHYNMNGIWRQAESWSCFQIDPPHIHGYRSLAYNLIFGNEFDRGTLNMYTYGQITEFNPGLVSETYSWNGVLGSPGDFPRGDDNSIYILNMYLQFKWYKDGVQYVGNRYKYVKAAMYWIINQSIPNTYGLPYRLINTNDEHGIIGDINTYNSMLYISALYSMKIMANHYESNNKSYLNSLDLALEYANGNLTKLLWQPNNNNGFYMSFWCANGNYAPYGLQSDVLYGYLWSFVLDLNEYWPSDVINKIISHLEQEKLRNWSQFGLMFMTNKSTPGYDCSSKPYNNKFKDRDTWEMATLDHASLLLFLNKNNINISLSMAKIGINKYRNLFKDQWDWRDTSSTYNDSDPEYSRPVVNSHYCRQLIHYSIIFGLNGQIGR
eukprot:310885_1